MPEGAVVDASCLIVLARAGRLDLLEGPWPRVVVPASVMDEVQAHRDGASEVALGYPWIHVVEDPPVPQAVAGWDLGPGESVVLAWALAHGATAVLDDFAARRCARILGVATIGTLGLALRARVSGRVSEARPVVESLRVAGLYLSDDLVRRALALVGE